MKVYWKQGMAHEITCESQNLWLTSTNPNEDGSPESDSEGLFARFCAANAVIWKLYMLQAKVFNDNLANSLNSDLDPLLIFVWRYLGPNRCRMIH
jgi:hypothetical protein